MHSDRMALRPTVAFALVLGVLCQAGPRTSAYRRPARRSLNVPWAPEAGAGVEQVHVVPSDVRGCGTATGGSAKVVFASVSWQRDGMTVSYSNASLPAPGSAVTQEVVAVPRTYSSLVYVNDRGMLTPHLGRQTVPGSVSSNGDITSAELAYMQNTTWWATDKQLDAAYYNPAAKPAGSGIRDEILDYKNPMSFYTSPVLYTATLTGLSCGESYTYTIGSGANAFTHTFTMPQRHAAKGQAYTFGVTADVGQTPVSDRTVSELMAMSPQAVLLSGDLAYADGWAWRWDSFGRMMQRLAAKTPVFTVAGDHEVLATEQWQHYDARYPMPSRASGSPSNSYWSMDMYGVHVLTLNAYASLKRGSTQQQWLWQDLASVDRSVTPWIVAMIHVPQYNSNMKHFGEQHFMKHQIEDVLYHAGVDLVISGHVHAYERSFPVYKEKRDECGPVYVTVGDAGNREGTNPWAAQPQWSAFRESSFGVAKLRVENSTHAHFSWQRHACAAQNVEQPWNTADLGANFSAACEPLMEGSNTSVSDAAWLVRSVTSCGNRLQSALSNLPPPPAPLPTPPFPRQQNPVEPWVTPAPTPVTPVVPGPSPNGNVNGEGSNLALGLGLGLGLGVPVLLAAFAYTRKNGASNRRAMLGGVASYNEVRQPESQSDRQQTQSSYTDVGTGSIREAHNAL